MAQDIAQGRAKGNFHNFRLTIRHVVIDSQAFGATGGRRTNSGKGGRAIAHNARDVCQCLYTVDSGWLIPQYKLRGIRWALFRHTAPPFDQSNLHGLLTTHKADINTEDVDGTAKFSTQNITSNEIGFQRFI